MAPKTSNDKKVKIKDIIPESQGLEAKIEGKNVPIMAYTNLDYISKHVVNIEASDISFDLLKNAKNQQTIIISPTGNEIQIPPAIDINGVTYQVISGRLIDDNPEINPFYQLEIQKL